MLKLTNVGSPVTSHVDIPSLTCHVAAGKKSHPSHPGLSFLTYKMESFQRNLFINSMELSFFQGKSYM